MFQRVVWGQITHDENKFLADLDRRELAMLAPLLILIVWMGIYSNHFLRPMDASVARLLQQTQTNDVEIAVNPK
jgi:NADH-quinone oxidoreductase subunit M